MRAGAPRDLLLAAAPGLDVGLLGRYGEEILRWNRAVRLVGPRDPGGVDVQIADALYPFLLRPPSFPLVDIGSGAGLPAIPIAVAFPGATVLCVEPLAKRASFLRHAARVLGLGGVRVLACRAEEAVVREPGLGGAFSCATARAVSDVPTLLALARPFLAAEGRAFLPRGGESPPAVAGWALAEDLPYPFLPTVGLRRLAVYAPLG